MVPPEMIQSPRLDSSESSLGLVAHTLLRLLELADMPVSILPVRPHYVFCLLRPRQLALKRSLTSFGRYRSYIA